MSFVEADVVVSKKAKKIENFIKNQFQNFVYSMNFPFRKQ